MKAIDKEKFEKRVKSGRYVFGFRYYGKTNKLELMSKRNEMVLMPKTMTDEDVILLSQLVDGLSETFHNMLVDRDLIPEDLKKAVMENKMAKHMENPRGDA